MKLFNTLTRSTDDFAPLMEGEATIYTCGPTVYDYAHVGHWFTYVRWDLLVRTLKDQGLAPNWVMNITDVGHLVSDADEGEDKLEKGAKREGKTAWEVAEFYTQDFLSGLHALNITEPNQLPKATEHIAEQIALIKQLEEKDYTYTIDDGVYYDTSRFEGYAALARLDLDDLRAGARVEYNRQKRNPTDFALWKFSPAGSQRDMEWDSPWGKGFPGWHIECSAMAMKYFGETLDIHAGGIDHVPVHHTNEIAQSEAVTGKRFANYWLHSNHVTVSGEKISKSLGNGIRLQDITDRHISLEAFRLHILESHYRSQSKFSWDSHEAAQNRLKGYQAIAVLQHQAGDDGVVIEQIRDAKTQIQTALADDLNTPAALAAFSSFQTAVEAAGVSYTSVQAFTSFLQWIDAVLGLSLSSQEDIADEHKNLIAKRLQARQDKDWAKSDAIRDQLAAQGISLRDSGDKTLWHRI
jgi:cysteinyl-tRNA synthetase